MNEIHRYWNKREIITNEKENEKKEKKLDSEEKNEGKKIECQKERSLVCIDMEAYACNWSFQAYACNW